MMDAAATADRIIANGLTTRATYTTRLLALMAQDHGEDKCAAATEAGTLAETIARVHGGTNRAEVLRAAERRLGLR